jgi:hypothetical protein
MAVKKHFKGAVVAQIQGFTVRQMVTDNEKQIPTGKFGVYRGKKLDKDGFATVVAATEFINGKIK